MTKLNELITERGDAVHRSKPLPTDALAPHLVKRGHSDKAIWFLKHFVGATERAAGGG